MFLPPDVELSQHGIDLRWREFRRELHPRFRGFSLSQVSRDGVPKVSLGLALADAVPPRMEFSQDHGGIGVPFFSRLAKPVSRGGMILCNPQALVVHDAQLA